MQWEGDGCSGSVVGTGMCASAMEEWVSVVCAVE